MRRWRGDLAALIERLEESSHSPGNICSQWLRISSATTLAAIPPPWRTITSISLHCSRSAGGRWAFNARAPAPGQNYMTPMTPLRVRVRVREPAKGLEARTRECKLCSGVPRNESLDRVGCLNRRGSETEGYVSIAVAFLAWCTLTRNRAVGL